MPASKNPPVRSCTPDMDTTMKENDTGRHPQPGMRSRDEANEQDKPKVIDIGWVQPGNFHHERGNLHNT